VQEIRQTDRSAQLLDTGGGAAAPAEVCHAETVRVDEQSLLEVATARPGVLRARISLRAISSTDRAINPANAGGFGP